MYYQGKLLMISAPFSAEIAVIVSVLTAPALPIVSNVFVMASSSGASHIATKSYRPKKRKCVRARILKGLGFTDRHSTNRGLQFYVSDEIIDKAARRLKFPQKK